MKPSAAHGRVIMAAAILVDQGTKGVVRTWLASRGHPYHVTSFFSLLPQWNWGIGWGMFPSRSWQGRIILITAALLFIAVLWSWYEKAENGQQKVGLGLIMGGGLSNAVDRIFHGAVFDFFHVHCGHYHFPTFNVADILITSGFLVFFVHILPWKKTEKSEKL